MEQGWIQGWSTQELPVGAELLVLFWIFPFLGGLEKWKGIC